MVGKLTFFAGLLITTTVQPMQTSHSGPVAPQILLSQGASGDASVVDVCGGMTAYPDAHDLARDWTIRPRNL